MPNVNDVFPSKFLKAHELQGREPIVTIDRVEFEQVGQKRDTVPVLYFVGKDKGLKLNKTMANKIVEISGSAVTEEWPGIKLKLYATEATFGGETFDVVRIKSANGLNRMPRMTAAPPQKPKPQLSAPNELPDDFVDVDDDSIPF